MVGFDDLPTSAFMIPPLTTVHRYTDEIGERAAEAMIDLIERRIPQRPDFSADARDPRIDPSPAQQGLAAGRLKRPGIPMPGPFLKALSLPSGEFVDLDGERYYVIRNVDEMPPFFISVISSADHWLFVSSAGGLTAGRVSPETALFPYLPVDRIHESQPHTGCKTILRVGGPGRQVTWEPFNREHDGRFATRRNLYKTVLGHKLCFEEVNHDLGLAFRYTWATSDKHGFVRQCELQNLGDEDLHVALVDGLQNILPAATPLLVQSNSSNLVDAYKWTELDAGTGLGMYALYARISDRAEPCESLRANVVYGLGLDAPTVLLSSLQLTTFVVACRSLRSNGSAASAARISWEAVSCCRNGSRSAGRSWPTSNAPRDRSST